MLYAFEQLIINTEDLGEEGDYYREEDTQFIDGRTPLSQSEIQEILEIQEPEASELMSYANFLS